ncbi:MAG: ribosomal RNA small subunit methyltransferase A [Candidatus Omnitrophica bacterium]|nr:ribosomal RNA small subunit methyltransferase A [Candidatus Omnitrophota bacterium]
MSEENEFMKQSELLKKYQIRPSKLLGQNFLVRAEVAEKIITALDPKKGETILEIGPGLGALTSLMLQRGAYVIGVEKDKRLIEILKKENQPYGEKFDLVCEDILEFDFRKSFGTSRGKVVGNLPYYLTSPLIFKIFEARDSVGSAMLMIQREVAERILASPGTPEYGRLTVAVAFFAEAKRIIHVSKKSFIPSPAVDSTVISFTLRAPEVIRQFEIDPDFFLEVVKALFSQRRKSILNCLYHARLTHLTKEALSGYLAQNGIAPLQRAEELFLKDFLHISRKLQELARISERP